MTLESPSVADTTQSLFSNEDPTPGRVRFDTASTTESSSNNFTVSGSVDADEVWADYAGYYKELKKPKNERSGITPEMEEMILNSSFATIEYDDKKDYEVEILDNSGGLLQKLGYGRRHSSSTPSSDEGKDADDKNFEKRKGMFNACIKENSVTEEESKGSTTSSKSNKSENDNSKESSNSDTNDDKTTSSYGLWGYFQQKKSTIRVRRSSGRLA